ncbi:hypothetical protein [Pseudoduganella sp. R-43]|uniref:hypothetical protein n=1 Tax=Pseudoduganella sp. R-43 TaxID=3404063 RepID=UPI003CEEF221
MWGGSNAATYAAFDGAGNLFTNASDTGGKYQFYGRTEGAKATIQDVLDNTTDPQQRLELLKYRFERWNVGAGEYASLGLELNPGDPRFTEMQQRANGIRDAVGAFSLTTVGGVAGLMTGGWAFGAARTFGAQFVGASAWGAIGVTGAAGVSAGVVGDLTSQALENVAYFASGKTIGHFGINKTELALSAGFGLAPILPSVVRQGASELRAAGLPDWKIGFTKPTSVRSVLETVQLERIGADGLLASTSNPTIAFAEMRSSGVGAPIEQVAMKDWRASRPVTTTAKLLESGELPGHYGFTLDQRTITTKDLWSLNVKHEGMEFVLTRETVDGDRVWKLYSGLPDKVRFPVFDDTQVFGHVHPLGETEKLPSFADINNMNELWRRKLAVDPTTPPLKSRIVWGPEKENVTLFTTTGEDVLSENFKDKRLIRLGMDPQKFKRNKQ